MIRVVIVVANEANEIQTEGVLNVLPTALDSRLRLSLGATYTISFCCKLYTGDLKKSFDVKSM